MAGMRERAAEALIWVALRITYFGAQLYHYANKRRRNSQPYPRDFDWAGSDATDTFNDQWEV